MAAVAVENGDPNVEVTLLQNGIGNMEIEEAIPDKKEPEEGIKNESSDVYKFGFSLEEVYKLSLSFYRKVQSALNIPYDDRLKLMAYWKQESCGKYDDSKPTEVGYLDVIGNDRRKAWQMLGSMTRVEAMKAFCGLLEVLSPEYTAFMGAQQQEAEEKERLRLEELERQRRMAEEERRRLEEQRLAEQKRLEEEEERLRAKQEAELANHQQPNVQQQNHVPQHAEEKQEPEKNDERAMVLAKASLWTRPKLQEFIQHVKRDASSYLVVGRGETVTIRVPTHENGTCLFWEFGTETYDIGFGVYFESVPQLADRSITVHVDESDASDEETAEAPKGVNVTNDNSSESATPPSPADKQIVEILPVLRRNSQNDVIVGSHVYPGQGVYLLKFDNSYSLFRSKSLYYRVYYTK